MQTALEAINFYTVQQQVVSNFRETRLADKAIQMKEQCNKKLAEVHNAYQNAKRKYQSTMQEKASLEQEARELQDKYRQKSKQNQELQRMYKELQTRNDSALRGGSGQSLTMNNHGSAIAMKNLGNMSPSLSNLSGGSGGIGGGQMVTTVHRSHQMYSLGGMTPPSDLVVSPSNQFGATAAGQLNLPTMMRGSPAHSAGHAQAMQRQQMLQGCLPGNLLGGGGSQPAKLLRSGSIQQARRK